MFGSNSDYEPKKTAPELYPQTRFIPIALPATHPSLVDFSAWIDQSLERLVIDFAGFETPGSNQRHFLR